MPRSVLLAPSYGHVHTYWRCHNREFYFKNPGIKSLHMKCIQEALNYKTTNDNVFVHAYCTMNNHFHSIMSYTENSQWLSRFMRQANGLFGARYNRLQGRTGKVAEGRPKTPLIQNDSYLMTAHFYTEANPVIAGLCSPENLHKYKFSSYRFYAFGIRDEHTTLLTAPNWYLKLGKTARQRQRKYRQLFYQYLRNSGYHPQGFFGAFIGTSSWQEKQHKRVKNAKPKNQASQTMPSILDSG